MRYIKKLDTPQFFTDDTNSKQRKFSFHLIFEIQIQTHFIKDTDEK